MLSAKGNLAAQEARQLRPFWREGRIIRWPAREGRRRLVLAEVVRTFPLGRRLAEAEVDTSCDRSGRTIASCGGRSSTTSCSIAKPASTGESASRRLLCGWFP